jgi:hypothetical protein
MGDNMAKKQITKTDENDALESFLRKQGIDAGKAKEVSASSWKWEEGVPKYFKVLGMPVKREKRAGDVKEPPYTVPVKDFESGNHQTLICNTMLFNQFQTYPGSTLIGKCFVSIMSPVEGKNYKSFDTREVPDPEPGSEE